MAQVKFGACIDEFAARPDLQPRFFGSFTSPEPPRCVGQLEEKRRKDVKPGAYGTGTPSIGSVQRDPWGVPLKYDGSHESVMTEQGPIELPNSSTEGWDKMFNPSVSLLNAVPWFDSRMRPLSDRYYNR